MTMKKRITSFALVLLMVLSSLAVLLPVTGVKAAAAETKTYTKVTTEPTDWSGTYLIVYEKSKTEGYAFNGVDAGGGSSYGKVTIDGGKITTNDSDQIVYFTIAAITGGYSIKINGGTNDSKYIGQTANSNKIVIQATALTNTIKIVEENESTCADIISNSTHFRFNSATGKDNDRFRYYKSATYSSQQPIQLYKLDTSSTPTEPDVPVHEGKHTYGEWTYNDTTHSHQCTIEGCKATETANHEITWTSLNATKHTGKCKCGYTTEGAHNWVTDTEATDVPDGKLAQKCGVCGEKRIIATPKEVTIDFTAQGYTDKQKVTEVTQNDFSLVFDKNEGANYPLYYNNGTAVRMYAKNTLTISAPDGVIITKIAITYGSKNGGKELTVNGEALNGSTTWEGSADTVVFTVGSTQAHFQKLVITYEAPATEPEAPRFESATLDIDKNIDVNFYVSVPNGYDVANLKMLFNFNGADTSVDVELVNTEAGTAYRFVLKDVAPHLMGEKITATLKNGDTVIATLEYSINAYLDKQKKDTTLSDNTKALIESIAAYGDKAADYNNKFSDSTTFTGTATADPADMTESKPTIGTTLEGFKFKGVAVRMENNIRIRVSFENTSGAELKFFVKVGDGKETEAILSNSYVYTDLIAPSAYDTEYTIIAKNADGETVGTVSLSVNTYVCMVLKAFPADGTLTNAQAAMRELAIAIYNYGKAAKAAIGA